ncbi:MAG: sigma-70 family RNA polymerase sigma factor [Acidobacteria bacterium]|nr:sigma-70 family RNA polymerase sigma factor [Acidobacteriota bacterium]MCA1636759.1 sigma-70 family RNA polymerase sigma factor [Acidobacteriota bacterium]
MNTNSEANLIEKLAHGDEPAFSEIYGRYHNRVYGFVYRMTGNQMIAEDLTHETFIILIEHPKRYLAERCSLLTFLCAVARNLVMNQLRRKHNRDVRFDDFENFNALESETKQNNPLADLLDKELAAQIDACIAALPPFQREVIILREFQELSYKEIAKVTEAELSSVKARLHRARQTLAKALAAYVTLPKKDKCYELH